MPFVEPVDPPDQDIYSVVSSVALYRGLGPILALKTPGHDGGPPT
jgi:hypothetical protein